MLQLILGRAGYGKTEYVFNSITKLIKETSDEIVLITPEQFSFESEKMLLNKIGEKNIYRVENTSFSRIGNEINRIYGYDPLPVLSQGSKTVMMKKAIEMVKDNLLLFSKSTNNPSFISSVIKIYDEMKSCRVTSDDILRVGNVTEKEVLSKKLKDFSAIMSAYDAIIDEKYLDPADELTRLYKKLCNLDYFCDKIVFIDGFNGFVAQEYKILEVILKQAKNVYITFCSDSDTNNDKFDLFSYVNSNISILNNVAKKIGVEVEKSIILDKPYRFNNEQLKTIEKFAFSNAKCEAIPNDDNNVKIYKARNICDECDNVSLEINKLFRKGIRASQIAVICRDYDKYKKEIEFSFNKYEIPYFNDERQIISTQPIIMFVNFLLRTVIYNFRSEDIFSLLKTGMTTLDDIKINKLENYVYMWNINGSQWKNEFTKSSKGIVEEITEQDKKQIDTVESSRKFVIDKIIKFNKSSKNQDAKGISHAIYNCIIDFKSNLKIKQLACDLNNNGKSALAEEQGKVWDLLMNILNNLAILGEDEKITVEDYYKLFNLMVSTEDLGSIPTGLDNIQVGSADRIRCNNPYAVFILGANEGEFPQNVSSAGLLSENDRIILINSDFKLYSYGETLLAQEKYFAYMAACSSTDYLYVSYCSGKDCNDKSSIVTGIENCLENLIECEFNDELSLYKIASKDNAFECLVNHYNDNTVLSESLKEYFANDENYSGKIIAVENLNNNTDTVIKDSRIAVDLFGKDMYLSASKVDEFYRCPFKYFCKFGIGATPRVKVDLDPMQTGTVIHYVLEKIMTDNPKKLFVELTDDEIHIKVSKILNTYLNDKIDSSEKMTTRFKYQLMRLSKMLIFVVVRLRDEMRVSDFVPKAFELKIGNDDNENDVKFIPIKLENGGSITIKGSIDRVDVYEENSKQYIRVIDYKSGTKDFNLSDILNGLNLQMFIYMFSLCESEHKLSGIGSGVLYMHSTREVYSVNDKEEVDSQENKKFKMQGVFLEDEDNHIINHMEHNIEKDAKFINVKNTEKGGYKGNILTLEELGAVSRKINRMIIEMGESLHKGNINQTPIDNAQNSICSYCDYIDVCKNRKEISKRPLKKVKDKEEFINKIYYEELENA